MTDARPARPIVTRCGLSRPDARQARTRRATRGGKRNTAAPACEAVVVLTVARCEPHWNTDAAAPSGRPFAHALFGRPIAARRGNTPSCQDIDRIKAPNYNSVYISPMDQRKTATRSEPPLPRTWDARLARSLVRPLVDTPVTPNHLTTVRLLIGLAGSLVPRARRLRLEQCRRVPDRAVELRRPHRWRLARISGKSSKIGHFTTSRQMRSSRSRCSSAWASGSSPGGQMAASPVLLGAVAGAAVALIFFLRMRIESFAGKAGTSKHSPAASRPKTCCTCCRS